MMRHKLLIDLDKTSNRKQATLATSFQRIDASQRSGPLVNVCLPLVASGAC